MLTQQPLQEQVYVKQGETPVFSHVPSALGKEECPVPIRGAQLAHSAASV